MPGLENLGRLLLLLGGILVLLGIVLLLVGRVPYLGRLPGDIYIQRDGFSCYIPLLTGLILSLILTILLNVIVRILR